MYDYFCLQPDYTHIHSRTYFTCELEVGGGVLDLIAMMIIMMGYVYYSDNNKNNKSISISTFLFLFCLPLNIMCRRLFHTDTGDSVNFDNDKMIKRYQLWLILFIYTTDMKGRLLQFVALLVAGLCVYV